MMNKPDDYVGDVFYEAWRRGMNPDKISYDNIECARWDGLSAEECVSREQRRQEELRQRQREEREAEEAYFRAMEENREIGND
jgi:hypothetical protein